MKPFKHVLLALLALCYPHTGAQIRSNPVDETLKTESSDSFTVEGYVDGNTKLQITKEGIFWDVGRGNAKVGRNAQHKDPCYVNGNRWDPKWSMPGDRGPDTCEIFPLPTKSPFLAAELVSASTERAGTGISRSKIITTVDQDQLVIHIPDPEFGAVWYKIRVTSAIPPNPFVETSPAMPQGPVVSTSSAANTSPTRQSIPPAVTLIQSSTSPIPSPPPIVLPTPQIAVPSGPSSAAIVLDRNWASPLQGGVVAMKELAFILSPFAQANPNPSPYQGPPIYSGVTYLMPLNDAKVAMNVNQQIAAKNRVAAAGFPKDSLFYYVFDGVYEGHFNKLYIVTDRADQVVCIQLVAENPRRDLLEEDYRRPDGHVYNLLLSRSKGTSRLWAENTARFEDSGKWVRYRSGLGSYYNTPKTPVMVLRVDSSLIDPIDRDGSSRSSNWRALEASRLYLPRPIIELILHCIQKGTGR